MGIMDSPLLVAIAVLVLAAIAAALLFYRSTPRDPLTAAPGSCEDGRDGLADRQSSLLLNSTARDYIRDARLILRHSNQPSRLALHGALQALELALKGYLRGRGWCIEHLRGHGKPNKNQVGHDLARAQKLATKAGLERLVSLREEDKTLIASPPTPVGVPLNCLRPTRYWISRSGFNKAPWFSARRTRSSTTWSGPQTVRSRDLARIPVGVVVPFRM
jgi:hypothetical protein